MGNNPAIQNRSAGANTGTGGAETTPYSEDEGRGALLTTGDDAPSNMAAIGRGTKQL